MRGVRFGKMVGVVAAAAVVALAGTAWADDCVGTSVAYARAAETAFRVEVRHGEKGWEQRFSPGQGADGVWWILPGGVPEHAHLVVAMPPNTRRFAVVRAGAEHEPTRRVLVYEAIVSPIRPGPPGPEVVLVKVLDLADLLTADELAQVRRSKSHLQWLAASRDGAHPVRVRGSDTVELDVVGGRTVSLDLDALAPAVKRP